MIAFTEEQLDRIEELAGLYLPISAIAIDLGVDEFALKEEINDSSSEAHRRYARGKTETQIEMRRHEKKLAMIGSPLAMQSMRDNLIEMEEDE